MRVYGAGGALVAESPSREAVSEASPAPAEGRTLQDSLEQVHRDLTTDARNLAPISIELEAVRLYAESGSLAEVSRALGIAIYQLQKLQRTEWWQAELAALRREASAIKNAKLTKIHNQTLAALEDRLEHGDYVLSGKGFVRVKMSGRDLARVSEAVFKQRQLLMGEPTQIEGGNKKLEALADKLRALGAKDASHLTIDVEARNVTLDHSDAPAREPEFADESSSGDA